MATERCTGKRYYMVKYMRLDGSIAMKMVHSWSGGELVYRDIRKAIGNDAKVLKVVEV